MTRKFGPTRLRMMVFCLFIGCFSSAKASQLTELHKSIWQAQSKVSTWYSSENGNCKAKLYSRDLRQQANMAIDWSGDCSNGRAQGDGKLTLLFDGVPVLTDEIGSSTRSTMVEGIPLTTMRPGDFKLLQSACNDQGMYIQGKPRGGTFAELPNGMLPSVWTIRQNGLVLGQQESQVCGGRVFPYKIFVSGQRVVVDILDRNARSQVDYLSRAVLNYPSFSNQLNAGVKRWKAHLAEQAQTVRKERADAHLSGDVPIENMANFLEAVGKSRMIAELAKGRNLKIKISDVSFENGFIIVTNISVPDSTKKLEREASKSPNSVNTFESIFNNSVTRQFFTFCRFKPDAFPGREIGDVVSVRGVLEKFDRGRVVLDCVAATP